MTGGDDRVERMRNPVTNSRALLWLARLSMVPLAILWGAIAWRVARDPSNHIAWSPLWGLPLPIIAGGLGLLVWRRSRDRAAGMTALVAVATVAGLYLLDRGAILLSYESWIARGMPGRPF